MSSYEKKIHLIVNHAMRRFNGRYTAEDLALETRVATNMLNALGVQP